MARHSQWENNKSCHDSVDNINREKHHDDYGNNDQIMDEKGMKMKQMNIYDNKYRCSCFIIYNPNILPYYVYELYLAGFYGKWLKIRLK